MQPDYASFGLYRAGRRRVTVRRPNNTTFNAHLYYPATATGDNTPYDGSGAPYPAVSFGHGFLQPPERYRSILEHLATWGYFVIATESGLELFPNHRAYSEDMRYCLTYLEQQNADSTSSLFGQVDTAKFGISGHSMGGGASILATAADTRIKAVANLAAAETNPSAIQASANVTVPHSLISGSADTITPLNNHGLRMYNAGFAPKLLPVIQGGWHCGFQTKVCKLLLLCASRACDALGWRSLVCAPSPCATAARWQQRMSELSTHKVSYFPMSELRWHPLLQEWVITATHRQERTFHPPPEYCPLCPTQPDGYPTEVPEPTYEIVVFENRFPSLLREPPAPAIAPTPFSPVMSSHGVCEVVLYTPDHNATLADLPVERIEQLICVWRDRYAELGARPEVQYVFIFENKGREIGVTLSHPHGQIYAYPFIPPKIERELDAMRRHQEATGGNLLREIVEFELTDGRRVVQQMDGWVSFVPFFARYPYEVYLAPEAARRDLLDLTDSEIAGLARILKDTLLRYDALWGFSMPYVMAQHPRPTDGAEHPYWQFHIEFYPPYRTRDKLKYLAGSESGAGVFINDTLPEETAKTLRNLSVPSA